MVYTVTNLITDAYYTSNKIGRDFETVSGSDLADGLKLLNFLIAFKTANKQLIPYFKPYFFDAVIGQEKYFIPDLITPQTLTFELDGVRYTMSARTREEYFDTPRDNRQILSLPFQYFFERTLNGSDLYMYFQPQQAYPFALHGKFALSSVALNQDLEITLDNYYIEYLRYGLAERICQFFGLTFRDDLKLELKKIEENIFQVSPPDLTLRKLSVFKRGSSFNYGDINIGRGYRP